jgi:uncharacterized protein YndB with AHSA1/START domain
MMPLKWAMVQANFHSVALETVNTELLMRRLAPKPWRPLSAELDVKVGGASLVVMGGRNGEQTPSPGIYLALEPGRRIVSTDAYERPCQPSAPPFYDADPELYLRGGGYPLSGLGTSLELG